MEYNLSANRSASNLRDRRGAWLRLGVGVVGIIVGLVAFFRAALGVNLFLSGIVWLGAAAAFGGTALLVRKQSKVPASAEINDQGVSFLDSTKRTLSSFQWKDSDLSWDLVDWNSLLKMERSWNKERFYLYQHVDPQPQIAVLSSAAFEALLAAARKQGLLVTESDSGEKGGMDQRHEYWIRSRG